MRVTIADYAGFCFGVERAIQIVNDAVQKDQNVVTFGPIIHNPQVVKELASRGVVVKNHLDEIAPEMTAIVRTHGATVGEMRELATKTQSIIDATCPFVKKVQEAVSKLSENDVPVVVVGEIDHPEVQGIVSYIKGKYFVISSVEDAQKLPYSSTYGIAAQTTQNEDTYKNIIDVLKGKCDNLNISRTICNATQSRQSAALKLAKEADVMIIVGGRNSANTTRLYQICKDVCKRVYHIETEEELTDSMTAGAKLVGVSAGASTPMNLVYKVKEYILERALMSNENKRSEESMEDFESMLEESLKQPTRGSTVKGVIAQIQGNEVIVNVGSKTEGVVDKSELGADVKVGDSVELVVAGFNTGGYMQLTRRMADGASEWNSLRDSVDKVVKVKIESKVDKGYRGKIGDIDAFIPDNHIDLKSRMKDPSEYIGKTVQAKVLKFGGNGRHKSALVSPKDFILEQENKSRGEFIGNIKVGDVMNGTIKTLKEYGAFVSFGAVDGFLHKSNISWGRPRNPAKFVEEGQSLDVIILEINNETGKIEVGLKQLSEDPWATVQAKYPIDSTVNAVMVGRRRNGFIGEAEPGVDVFVPLEELTWLRNSRISVNPKDKVEGRVLDYDNEHKRIIISVKMMTENPWQTLRTECAEGSTITGTVKNVTDFGVFVDFGQFVDGLIRKSDVTWGAEPTDLNTLFKAGDEVQAKVLKIDEERERVSLGLKQLAANPWRDMPKSGTKGGNTTEVTIAAVTKNGLDVTLPNGLVGQIPSNELDPANASLDSYNVGDKLTAIIIKADQKDRTLLLSVRKMIVDSERKETKEYMKKLEKSDEGQGFGAIFKDILK
ncbi:MAG: 4-hydroxy-3-methylbut-2-enyl diphosphate reductase [Deferribacteraceae bacterium]|jgi:ribosomal protein S1/(E)-4-hydroxy-3-methyl-but-2-enyl pyrophosphate reductase|nr:4-hydroxy-3-methylbut-2-enyl diphosphate reductase [Deferribacteraceae bacterium]